MSWLSEIWGNNDTATRASNSLASAGTWATSQGEGDINASSTFMRDLLSGDPTKIATSLQPVISGQAKQNQQQKNQLAEFAPRSGGTAAASNNIDTSGRGNLINLTGDLTGKAASGLGTMGTNLFSAGTGATEKGAEISLENKPFWQDLLLAVGEAGGKAAGSAAAGGA